MLLVLGLLIAYGVGSFPSAYLAGRIVKQVDLRTLGSGNLGATNVLRTLGWQAAVAVLLIDGLKGALPTYYLPRLFGAGHPGTDMFQWWGLAYGAAAICGHAKPVFLLWKGGGKGVATASGMFAVLAPGALAGAVCLSVAVVWLTGYMSVASIVSATAFPILVWLDRGSSPTFWASIGVGTFIWWTHRSNVKRLRAGTEHRLFDRKARDA
jgi:glycerol-3-phosphate acyltransferase PlsY